MKRRIRNLIHIKLISNVSRNVNNSVFNSINNNKKLYVVSFILMCLIPSLRFLINLYSL